MSEIAVEIDHDLCYGAQNCSRVAPGAFEYDADGKAIAGDTSSVTPEQLRMARDQCPAMAITVAGIDEA